jgi:putative toxin-antitoxin system antitoxin component (TIGR02293 family)
MAVLDHRVSLDDSVARLLPVIAHAVGVFGDEKKALHWLETPLAIFDGKAPSQLLTTTAGIASVEAVLTRIEHNIPS